MALDEARVSSLEDTLLRSVSSTPDFKLSTSMFDTVLLSTSMVLLVRVHVDVGQKFNSNSKKFSDISE